MAEFASRPDEIARDLRDDILRGRYQPGQRLPSERDLAAATNANRSSVREALKKLEQLRLIEIRRGGGARVSPLDQASPDVLVHLLRLEGGPDPVLVDQWMDVYELVVTGGVRFAVERATSAEIERARRLLDRFRDPALGDEAFLRTTDELVELTSAASRNVVLRMVRGALRAVLVQRITGGRRPRLPQEVLVPIAAALDDALAQRDAAAAEESVRRLLRFGRERLLKAIEARRS